jgi:hypothetical protein
VLGAVGCTTTTGAGAGAGLDAWAGAEGEEAAGSELAEPLPAAAALLDAGSALLADFGALEFRSRSDVCGPLALACDPPLVVDGCLEATLTVSPLAV